MYECMHAEGMNGRVLLARLSFNLFFYLAAGLLFVFSEGHAPPPPPTPSAGEQRRNGTDPKGALFLVG